MTSEILNALRAVERRRDVTILFAVEAGSRAWGIESHDSDYDIRFVYRQKLDQYLTVEDSPRDTIENAGEEPLDISGWDVRKALRLFRKSNPSLLEWVSSPTVYKADGLLARLRELSVEYSSGAAAIYHYHHMAKSNFREYLRTEQVKLKKYLYVVRPLLAVRWITNQHPMPVPVTLSSLLTQAVFDGLDREVFDAITMLVDQKRKGEELGEGPRVDALSRFIETSLGNIDGQMQAKGWMESYAASKVPLDELNALFRQAVRARS